jgi:hypothetical protein
MNENKVREGHKRSLRVYKVYTTEIFVYVLGVNAKIILNNPNFSHFRDGKLLQIKTQPYFELTSLKLFKKCSALSRGIIFGLKEWVF